MLEHKTCDDLLMKMLIFSSVYALFSSQFSILVCFQETIKELKSRDAGTGEGKVETPQVEMFDFKVSWLTGVIGIMNLNKKCLTIHVLVEL